MYITKCDKCGKKKAEKNSGNWIALNITGRDLSFRVFHFCEKCGDGIISKLGKDLKLKRV